MEELLLAALGGFAASLIDGSLGMGFGPTSSTVLLGAGIPPATVSTTVNLAKIATGAVSGAAHWRLGNVDRAVAVRLAGLGSVGAVVGAVGLVAVDEALIRPLLATLLLLTGLRLLARFARRPEDGNGAAAGPTVVRPPTRGLALVAVGGGVTTGLIGAWGPVVTPYLLHRRVAPRIVVGTVNAAEVVVAVAASMALLGSTGGRGIDVGVVVAMLAGGVVAAPVAARAVHRIPPRLLGLTMAVLLVGTQLRQLASALDHPLPGWSAWLMGVAGALWLLVEVRADRRGRRTTITPEAGLPSGRTGPQPTGAQPDEPGRVEPVSSTPVPAGVSVTSAGGPGVGIVDQVPDLGR